MFEHFIGFEGSILIPSERRFKELVEKANDIIYIFDLKEGFKYINSASTKIVGYTPEEHYADKELGFKIIHPDDASKLSKLVKDLVEKKKPVRIELRWVHKNGKVIWTEQINIPVHDKDGNVVAIEGVARDITERKDLEEELKASNERFRLAADASPDAIIFVDSNGMIAFWNKSAEEMFGYTVNEAVGASASLLILEKDKTRFMNLLKTYISSGEPFPNVPLWKVARKKNGDLFPIEASFSRWQQKDVFYLMVNIRDATQRQIIENGLRRQTEELTELIEEKTRALKEAELITTMGQVTTMVGHDLRNPLQVLVNILYLAKKMLKNPPYTALEIEHQRRLESLLIKAQEQIDYMNKIVLDLQDFGRSLEPKFVCTELKRLITEALAMVNIPKQIYVLIDVGDNFPSLMIDSLMIKRVLVNLINNSMQAMPKGGKLIIKASLNGGTALIEVQDTGVGIPEEHRNKLFTPFFTTKPKGQGLGLVVCEKLVKANGGWISFESEVGVGTTFSIRLPLSR